MLFQSCHSVLKQSTGLCVIIAIGLGAAMPVKAGSGHSGSGHSGSGHSGSGHSGSGHFRPTSSPFDELPNARAGECFARVMIPAQYENQYHDVVVDEGGSRIQVSDAQFTSQSQQILIRDAGVRYVVRQPIYKVVTEQMVVRPGYERLVVEPAQYRSLSEQVVVAPPRTAWKPGKSLAKNASFQVTQTHNGEVYCLVEIPAETKTVSKRVQVSPQKVRTVAVPPVYRNITRHVMVDPGGVQEVPVEAQYTNVNTQVLTQPAGYQSHAIAPRTERIASRQIIAEERYGWIRVLCKTNATPQAISGVQKQLHQLGFYDGGADGHIGLSTQNAVQKYQDAVGIPHGGYLSFDTLDALREGRTAPVRAAAYASASSNGLQNTQHVQKPLAPSGEKALHGYAWGGQSQRGHSQQDVLPTFNNQRVGAPAPLNVQDNTVYRDGQIIANTWLPMLESSSSAQGGSVPGAIPVSRAHERRLTWAGKS